MTKRFTSDKRNISTIKVNKIALLRHFDKNAKT